MTNMHWKPASARHNDAKSLLMFQLALLLLLLLMPTLTACKEVGGNYMTAKKYFSDSRTVELAEAAAKGDRARMEIAIAEGANVNARGRDEMTPLFFVIVTTKNPEGIRALIKAGADADHIVPELGSAVTVAARAEGTKLLQTLLAAGANPNSRNDGGEPAIIVAAMHGNYEHIWLLLDAGADINGVDAGGDTVSITLASLNQYEQVAKLIDRGASVAHVANNGQTIANTLERSLARMDPNSSNCRWGMRVKQMLIERGVAFPPPTAVELRQLNAKPE
jgi:uncharacterized protein